jgi:hypothetical protein
MKNQTIKAMVKLMDENPMIKLWHQLATKHLLVVCLY